MAVAGGDANVHRQRVLVERAQRALCRSLPLPWLTGQDGALQAEPLLNFDYGVKAKPPATMKRSGSSRP